MKVLLLNMKGVYPPIGLGYLASAIESLGTDVEILDYGGLGLTNEQLLKNVETELKRKNPDILGITCFTRIAPLAFNIARISKQVLPHCFVVLGGPHPTADPINTCSIEGVDGVVLGEGERTFRDLVSIIEQDGDKHIVNGMFWKNNGKIVKNSPRDLLRNLDELPYPAYHLFPDFKLRLEIDAHGILTHRHPYMPIFSSRGCPFKCIYCHRIFQKVWRPRSPTNVVDEIEFLCGKYGVQEIHFEDDNFNLDIDRAKQICDEIVNRDLDISMKFPNGIRADYVDEELIIKLKKAGCYGISIGVETASPRIMRLIKKNLDLKKVQKTVDLAVKHDIQVRGFFMLGFPTETKEDMQLTIDFAMSLNLHFAGFSIATPYPGTDLYEIVKSLGFLHEGDHDEFFFGNPVIDTPNFTREELLEIRQQAEIEFYDDPKRKERLESIEFAQAETLDYYTSPIYDFYHMLLINNFGGYGQSIPSFYKRKDD